MKRIRWALAAILLAAFFALLYDFNLQATLKHKKETGKKCTFCHTGIPLEGDEDPQLNAEGKKFKENGYQLTDEQKKKPD